MPARDGALLGRVASFLLSALQPGTIQKYNAVLGDFSAELQARGLRMEELDEETLDLILAERVVDMFEEQDGGGGIGAASTLLASMSKVHPRHRYRTAWRALDVWRQRRPPQHAPCMPKLLALGIVNWALLMGQDAVACVVLLCFTGLLRGSEALYLGCESLYRTAEGYTLVLGRTKRGLEQKVVISADSVVVWPDHYVAQRAASGRHGRLCPISYGRLQRWIQLASDSLGFGSVHWTSHSLRRGGATALLQENVPLADIMLYGRWASQRSAQEYLRRGEVSLTALNQHIALESWQRCFRFASLGHSAWACARALAGDDS